MLTMKFLKYIFNITPVNLQNAKVEAAKHLESGNAMGYKNAKMGSKLLQELKAKYSVGQAK